MASHLGNACHAVAEVFSMPVEEARPKKKVPRGDLASVAPANIAAAKEEFLAQRVSPRFAAPRAPFCLPACCMQCFHFVHRSSSRCLQCSVAPRFIYQSSSLSRGLALAAFSHSDIHAAAAMHVLQRVLRQFGSWSHWEQHCNGGFLETDEVDRRVAAYLARLRCDHVISVAWAPGIVAPTMLAGRRLLLRGPYREGRVQSVSFH
jgi:hypothetical protein